MPSPCLTPALLNCGVPEQLQDASRELQEVLVAASRANDAQPQRAAVHLPDWQAHLCPSMQAWLQPVATLTQRQNGESLIREAPALRESWSLPPMGR